ncbi:MAG: CpaF family protein [Lachnospiraceae bacterium]|nr:CpaF family protein [Lachnospiraceae bacterium]
MADIDGNELDYLRNQVLEKLDMSIEPEDEVIKEKIADVLKKYQQTSYLTIEKRMKLQQRIFSSIRGLDILQSLLEDEAITEIMVNGAKDIFIEKNGKIYRHDECFPSEERLQQVIQKIVSKVNRRVNDASPIADARLEDGSRVNVVLPPVSLGGAILTIRKFPKSRLDLNALVALGSITEEAAEFLKKLVCAKYNIFISGGTGSGKTTFLNALSAHIPAAERIITIEDSAELQLQNIENLVRMEVRQANTEGENEVSMRQLIKASLRMRPDRIVVGEVRGEETIEMLMAMSTGHDGSLSTGHGNSAKDMLMRMETMVLMGIELPLAAIRNQIATAIDILIHLGRLQDGSRKVLEISEIQGIREGEIVVTPLYRFVEEERKKGKVTGRLQKTDNAFQNRGKWKEAGL